MRLVFRRHAATRFYERLVYGGVAGAARIKYTAVANERNARLNFTRSLLERLHALRIYTRRDAASATQKRSGPCARRENAAARNTEAQKCNNMASVPSGARNEPQSEEAFRFVLSQAFKNRLF